MKKLLLMKFQLPFKLKESGKNLITCKIDQCEAHGIVPVYGDANLQEFFMVPIVPFKGM